MLLLNGSNELVQVDTFKILKTLSKSELGVLYHVKDTINQENEYLLFLYDAPFDIELVKQKIEILKILNSSSYFLKAFLSKKVLNRFFIVSEYPKGKSLKSKVESRSLNNEDILDLIHHLLESLVFLYRHNLTFNDINLNDIVFHNNRWRVANYDMVNISKSSSQIQNAVYTLGKLFSELFEKSHLNLAFKIEQILTNTHSFENIKKEIALLQK